MNSFLTIGATPRAATTATTDQGIYVFRLYELHVVHEYELKAFKKSKTKLNLERNYRCVDKKKSIVQGSRF